MYNLTLSLDPAIVRDARIRAIGEGTSVSAMVREFLQHYVKLGAAVLNSATVPVSELAAPKAKTPGERFAELAQQSTYDSGGTKWDRSALYDRKIAGR